MAEQYIPILSRLAPPEGATRSKKRKGRGPGSGLGKTAGRGQKGQKARQPGNIHKLFFEGGQMPLSRRLPKVGFVNLFARDLAEVSVGRLELFASGETIDEKALRAKGLIKGKHDGFKVLGNGALTKKLTVRAEAFSAGAKQKIESAGGTCELIERKPAPVVRHKNKAKKK
jgi:large subunit ribosomal protein L15